MRPNADFARDRLKANVAVICGTARESAEAIIMGSQCIAAAFSKGNKLLLCGNGGSAADCQHIASEFTNQMSKAITRPALPAIALTTDTSFLTGHSNDFGFQSIFSRQIEAIGCHGDVLLAISTSGNSGNILRAIETAQSLGLHTIGLSGSTGRLRDGADIAICIPSEDSQLIQEAHIAVEHIICSCVERILFSELFEHVGEQCSV